MDEHASLTDRERETARQLITVGTVVEISEAQGVSPFTVATVLETMNEKTNTATMSELAIWARSHEVCCCS